jgi:hypothetical protein
MMAKVLVAMGMAAWMIGCGCSADDFSANAQPIDPPKPSAGTQAALSVDLGTGETTFAALADGADVAYVSGPQGGYHVWTAVRVHDASVRSVRVNLAVLRADGSALGTPSGWAGATSMPTTDDDAMDLSGLKDYVDAAGVTDGETVTLKATVIAPDGRFGEAARSVRLHADR